MNPSQSLRRRLSKDFILQAIYISCAVTIGILAVTLIIEDVLIKQALRGEAEFYWQTITDRPTLALPETRNMISYRDDIGIGIPDIYSALNPGFHRIEEPSEGLVYVTENNGKRLVQIFDIGRVGSLITWFGLVPLATVLAGVYMSLYQAYKVSSRAVSPIVNLSKQVEKLDPANPDVALFNNIAGGSEQNEIGVLNSAMQALTERLVQFTKREFNFTRDASHELRSPLTVIKMAIQSIEKRNQFDAASLKLIDRIKNSVKDMEELTDAFLMLARESDHSLPADWILLDDVLESEVDRAKLLIDNKPLSIERHSVKSLTLLAPEKVLASVIGNVLRNSVTYTEQGAVILSVSDKTLSVKDSGPGMDQFALDQLFTPFRRTDTAYNRGGYGVGLTIVKRLCDRFGWHIDVNSELGVGTEIRITFPNARAL